MHGAQRLRLQRRVREGPGRSVQTRLRVLSQRFLRRAQCVPMLARLRPNGRARLYAVLRERVRERGVRGAERVCVSRGFRAEWE